MYTYSSDGSTSASNAVCISSIQYMMLCHMLSYYLLYVIFNLESIKLSLLMLICFITLIMEYLLEIIFNVLYEAFCLALSSSKFPQQYLISYRTNQHSCNNPNNHCNLVLQYMCHNLLRDGVTTR